MPTTFGEPFELDRRLSEDLMAALRRRKTVIVLVLLATIVGAYLALFLIPEQYEAHARLLVKLGRENTEVPITVEKGGVFSSGVQKEEINSYIQLLGSRAIVESAVDQVGVERFYPEPVKPDSLFGSLKYYFKSALRWVKQRWRGFLVLLDIEKEIGRREGAILGVEASLKVERERDSNVILISLRLPDATLARDVIVAMLDLYMERHVELRRDVNVRAVFDGQVELRRKQLEGLQQNLADIKARYHLSSITEERVKLLGRLHDLQSRAQAEDGELLGLRSQQRYVRERIERLDPSVKLAEVIGPNPLLKSIRDRLLELKLARIQTASRYAEGSQPVVTLDEEIAQLSKLLETEKETQAGDITYGPEPLRKGIESDLFSVEYKMAGLNAIVDVRKQQVAAVESALEQLNVGEDKMHVAERERDVVEQEYLSYVRRRGDAQIDEELDLRRVANVAVLSPPAMSFQPVYPPKLLLMGAALAAGLLLGIGLALMLEWKSDVIHGPDELARIPGLPLLGVFHLEPSKARA